MTMIRPANFGDFDALDALNHSDGFEVPMQPEQFLDSLGEYVVAVEDGRVVGYCHGHHHSNAWENCETRPRPSEEWVCSYVWTIAVKAEARGLGLGTALMRDFMQRGVSAGSSWIVVMPAADQRGIEPPVRRFFEGLGLFLLEPKAEPYPQDPWLMGAPLDANPSHEIVPAGSSRALPPAIEADPVDASEV